MRRTRRVVLWRAFFAQFFASDTIGSEEQLRVTIVGLIGFLLVPGLLPIVEPFFNYQGIVLRAIRDQQFEYLADTLEWIALVFVTCSAVTVGFVGACVWDLLVFDRRDALVLGRLPLSRATIVTAKTAAVGVAIVFAALARVRDFAALTVPRTAVLWIPLVLAYWSIVGLRAAFFVRADLPAEWIVRVSAPAREDATWSAVRVALMGCVLPPIAIIALLVIGLPLGWVVAITHAAIVGAISIVMIEIAALTIAFVPFTRAYQPGRARLRTRWWLYVIGIDASAIWPVRFELRALGHPAAVLVAIAALAGIAGALATAGRRQSIRLASSLRDDVANELTGFTVLDIGMAVHGASRT